jgi:glycine hydroxymethyltransferase
MPTLREVDPETSELIRLETERQSTKLVMIASENFVSEAVLEAQGSILTNKYAEGYPNKRYYGGCEFCDRLETLAISRAKKLFGADHVNVQPHSGTQANMAVFFSVLEPGDTILGMERSHGGHLSNGSPVNFSGKLYRVITYGVHPETHLIDYEKLESIALNTRPKIIISGASSYPRTIDFKRMGEIARKAGAYHMADIAHPVCGIRYHNNPQNLTGTERWDDHVHQGVCSEDRQLRLPGYPGRPPDAYYRSKSSMLPGSLFPCV